MYMLSCSECEINKRIVRDVGKPLQYFSGLRGVIQHITFAHEKVTKRQTPEGRKSSILAGSKELDHKQRDSYEISGPGLRGTE
jgi:hypothetical protein